MNFELTEQQKAIQEAARKFAQEELLPGVLERDEKSEFPVEQFHKAGELGFIGLPYPKEYGGQGLGYMSQSKSGLPHNCPVAEKPSGGQPETSFGIRFSSSWKSSGWAQTSTLSWET